jgi:hypothetical protein
MLLGPHPCVPAGLVGDGSDTGIMYRTASSFKNTSTIRTPSAKRPLRYGEVQVAWVLKCLKNHECSLSSLQCEFAARPFRIGASKWTILPGLRGILQRYAWGEFATALLALQQLSDHFRTGVSHAG